MTDAPAHRLLTARQVHAVLWDRQVGTCLACHQGVRPDELHAHHRVRRRDLGWCPCNVVGLHASCHVVAPEAVHQRPAWARDRGLIVPSWADPRRVPVFHQVPWRGWLLLDCDGTVRSDDPPTVAPAQQAG